LALRASRDLVRSLLRGSCGKKPYDGGEPHHHYDDRSDETGSGQNGREKDSQGDGSEYDKRDRNHS